MGMPQEEIKKQQEQTASGGEGPGGGGYYRGPDPFIQYLLQRLDGMETKLEAKIDKLDAKVETVEANLNVRIDGLHAKVETVEANLNARINGLHQELHGTNRWAIGAVVAVVVGLGGVIISLLAVLAKLP